jgi:hypothetical protein
VFLFELLSFAGEYDRAEKHLDIPAPARRHLGCRLDRVLWQSRMGPRKLECR